MRRPLLFVGLVGNASQETGFYSYLPSLPTEDLEELGGWGIGYSFFLRR